MQSGDSIAADRREAATGSFVRKTNESDVVGSCARGDVDYGATK